MKLETITERIANATATIEKKRATITKKEAAIVKKQAIIAKTENERERRWIEWDVENLRNDIERLHSQIAELEQKLVTYSENAEAIKAEPKMPEHLSLMIPDITKMLDENGEAYAEYLKKEYYNDRRKFFVNHHRVDYEWFMKSPAQRHNENAKDAEDLIRDLYRRVNGITGDIMDWNGLNLDYGTHGFTAINGRVEGERGTARVESIFAGGYNIQRLHVRVLVHEVK